MRYIISAVPDVEEIFIDEIKNYLMNEIKFQKIYKNFGNIKISSIHPMAYVLDQNVNGGNMPTGLFPSITLVNESDGNNARLEMPVNPEENTITISEISEIENTDLRKKLYIISDDDLLILKDMVNEAPGNKILATGYTKYRTANMVMEIWDENMIIKNRIFDLMVNFFFGEKRFTIKDKYNIVVVEGSIRGQKGGNFNYDFGKMLFGGILRFDVDFSTRQYIIDSDVGVLEAVDHYKENIHNP
jgi:hypothetical protein